MRRARARARWREVGHDLAEAGVVAQHDDGAVGSTTSMVRSGSTARASRTASSHELPRSTGARSSGRPWSRRARWSRSSTSVPMRTASCSVRRMASSSSAVCVERPGAVELGVPADGRDRRAQLVRRVGDELPQPGLGRGPLVEGLLDAAEHPVEGHAEVAGLGAGRALGHALATGRPPRWRRRSRSSAAPAARRGGSPTTSRGRARRAPRAPRPASTATRRRTASSTSSSGSAMHGGPAVSQLDALRASGSRRRVVARRR